MNKSIDLKKEQLASLYRPRYSYTFVAKCFFWGMDLLAGKKHTLPKAKLLEILASIPYREWEMKEYFALTRSFRNNNKIKEAEPIITWSREAQDNEYMHLLVIHEKMKEEAMKDTWYLSRFMVFLIVYSYIFMSRLLKWVSLKKAFHFNAQFEDHAEHVYAEMVDIHPEWENQPVINELVKQYANVPTWADVFRRIGLDERHHRNQSFYFCGKGEFVVD